MAFQTKKKHLPNKVKGPSLERVSIKPAASTAAVSVEKSSFSETKSTIVFSACSDGIKDGMMVDKLDVGKLVGKLVGTSVGESVIIVGSFVTGGKVGSSDGSAVSSSSAIVGESEGANVGNNVVGV